jgi:hypothetical protein
MRHNRLLGAVSFCLTAVLVLATASESRAAVITYSSSAAFEAALASFDTWDFTGAEGNPVIFLNSLGTDIVSVASQGGDAAGIIHDNALCGSSGGTVDCFKPIVLTLLEPRNAFGFDNLDLNGFEEAVIDVSFAAGPPFSTVIDLGAAPPFTPIFFGLIATENLTSVTIYSRDPGSNTVGERANVIDNLRVGTAAVPEPVTLTLIGFGVGAVLLRRRRR